LKNIDVKHPIIIGTKNQIGDITNNVPMIDGRKLLVKITVSDGSESGSENSTVIKTINI
jgi:hypothetical protein